jgi:glycosyltransferase involved in cell wall biosynthesis
MHVLVISPIPSHPVNQGNSARIARLCRTLQFVGAKVYFVYVVLEGCEPDHLNEMRAAWDGFECLQPHQPNAYSTAECNLIDDWYKDILDRRLKELFRLYKFDMALVNYVWFSRALLEAPNDCAKVIDTHDVFGGRHDRLLADGIAPAWFYTTPAQEGLGLDRADVVIAIQDEEAEILRQRTRSSVIVVGHLLPANFRPSRRAVARRTVGYIASANPTNIYSYHRLEAALHRRPSVLKKYEFLLAGPICRAVNTSIFQPIGELRNVETFYDRTDIVVNPNLGGTGLKIKTVEALSYGRPLVCTSDSMVGIETSSPAHDCADPEAIVDYLEALEAMEPLAAESRTVFSQYQRRQLSAVERLVAFRSGSSVERRRGS